MNGWVKLHKKTLENEVYRFDPTAWRIFLHLLLVCDYKSGVWKGGIKQLAGSLDMPKTTAYEAIKRLADRNMVVCKPNALYTAYHICKWSEYQYETERRPSRDRLVTDHKPTLLKNKEVRIKNTNVRTLGSTYGNAEVNKVVSEFETLFGYRMPLVKANRNAASNLIKRYGLEKTLGAIKYAASVRDEPYQPTIADLRDLWVKMPKLAIAYTKSNNGMVIIKGDDGSN